MPKDSAMAFIPLDFHKLNLEKNKEYMLTLRLVEKRELRANGYPGVCDFV